MSTLNSNLLAVPDLRTSPKSIFIYLIKLAIVTAVYYLTARLGLNNNVPGTNVGLIWPPVGIMLGLMLIMGYSIWPAVALGSFLSLFPDLYSLHSPLMASVILFGQSFADVFELILAVYLVKRFCDVNSPFKTLRSVLIFIAIAVVSQAAGALLGVLSLYLGDTVPWSAFASIWMSYWISNIESILILVPFIIVWFQDWNPLLHLTPREIWGHLAVYTFILIATYLVFRAVSPLPHTSVEYFTILLIIAAAIILGRHGASAASLLVAVIAIRNTALGLGPFAQSSPQQAVLYLDIYLVTLSACSIIVSTLLFERSRSEAGLRKFQRAIEHSNTSILITDSDGAIEYVNPRFLNITGYTGDEVIGKNPGILKSGYTLPEEYANLWKTIKSGKEWQGEFLNKKKNGELFWEIANISPIVNEKNQITHFVGIKEDITERKKNEQDIAALLQFKNEMLETAAMWIDTLDLKGNITFWNLAAERISGYSSAEVLGSQDIWDWLYPDPAYHTLINNKALEIIYKGERVENFETTILCKNGERRIISWHSNNVTNEKGEIIGSIAIGADVTLRKQAEAEIMHLNLVLEQRVTERTRQLEQSNKELESFAYSISHDLRSPLRAINGFTHILDEEHSPNLNPEAKNIMGRILANTQRMGSLIDDLLKFSRNGRMPLQKQTLQPESIIQRAFEDLQHERVGREVVLSIISPLPSCEGDPVLIKQVFINLISNAIKFTRSRSTSEIEIGYICDPSIKEGFPGYYYIRDNGVGFDMQYRDKLFGVFQRLHSVKDYEGTGVGLANVQRIIQRHGGHVWAQAETDRGATFFFAL